MADFNKFGRALGEQAQNLSRGAVDKFGDAGVDVAGEAGRLRALLQQMRPGPGPVAGRWALGIGDVLASHPSVPAPLRGVVKKLDRYGGLAISEQEISVDGTEVRWSSVTRIRTQSFVEYLLSGAVQEQVRTMPIPWFPGRKKLLEAVSKAVLTVLFAAAHEQLDRQNEIQIPAEIRYQGTGRERSVAPGIMATLLLADPAVSQCFFATAGQRGVTVLNQTAPGSASAAQRADQLRGRLTGLESKLGQWRITADSPEPALPVPASVDTGATASPPVSNHSTVSPASAHSSQGAPQVARPNQPSDAPPNQPLFSAMGGGGAGESVLGEYPQLAAPTGYPQIGATGPVKPDRGATANRQLPKWLVPTLAGIAALALIGGVLAFVGPSRSHDNTASSKGSESSDSSETDYGSGSRSNAAPSVPRESVPPPLVSTPDSYGESCGAGFHVGGQTGWATNSGRGSVETSCSFAHSVLMAYWAQYGQPSPDPRMVTATGRVPCPSTGGRCSGNDFVMECASLGSDPWITCTGGRNARVYIY